MERIVSGGVRFGRTAAMLEAIRIEKLLNSNMVVVMMGPNGKVTRV